MKILAVFLMILVLVIPTMAGYYEPVLQDMGDGNGTLYIGVLCHHNLFSKDVLIKEENGTWSWAEDIVLNPSGYYEARYRPGKYNLWLLDGNGGHPEFQNATVYEGYQTKVTFIGHAVSGHGDPEPTPTTVPTITPTPQPTITPTPTLPPEPCKVWIPGYMTWVHQYICCGCNCYWVWIPHWTPGYWSDCNE